MNEIQQATTAEVLPAADVLTGQAQVWVIATGEYDERQPVAVVHGTKDDAERYAHDYNAEHPWTNKWDMAHVWCAVDFIAPRIQG